MQPTFGKYVWEKPSGEQGLLMAHQVTKSIQKSFQQLPAHDEVRLHKRVRPGLKLDLVREWIKCFIPQEQSFELKTSLHIPIIPFTLMSRFPIFILSFPRRSAPNSCTFSTPEPYLREILFWHIITLIIKFFLKLLYTTFCKCII